MSSEWPLKELELVAEEVTVGYVGPMASEYVDEGVPFLRSLNIEAFRVNVSEMKYVSLDFHQRIKKSALRPGDVAIVRTGKPGTCAVIPDWLAEANCSDLVIVRCGKEIRPRFLCYWVNSIASHHISSHTVGAVQQHFNVGAAKKMKVAVPDISTQDAVVEVLGSIDDRITLLRETNTTLEAISQALFKSWFVDFDPVRAKAEGRQPEDVDAATAALFSDRLETSVLGDLPVGWEVRPIGEMVAGIYDGPHATPPEADDGPVFLGIKNLTGTSLDLSGIRHISESDWVQWTRRVEPKHGDIVFSYEATLGFFALIPPDVRCCLGRRLALVRPHAENGAGLFWFHQFISTPFQQLLDKHTIHGATVNRIALKAFPGYLVINPPEPLKLAFDGLVAPLWAAIHENQARAQTLTQLRDTLLPRLVSGQLRLPEAELMLAETG
ncbi:restriction endonuclease subunit S [Pseudomonas sp. MAHUQ-62]|uniref:restriction endonuclease subunit S n=1 Tax=Pseudomonas sp. GCM10023245 TaxID=3252652 RepID=UPI00361775B8